MTIEKKESGTTDKSSKGAAANHTPTTVMSRQKTHGARIEHNRRPSEVVMEEDGGFPQLSRKPSFDNNNYEVEESCRKSLLDNNATFNRSEKDGGGLNSMM